MNFLNIGISTILTFSIIREYFGTFWLGFANMSDGLKFEFFRSPAILNGTLKFLTSFTPHIYILNIGDLATAGIKLGTLALLIGLIQLGIAITNAAAKAITARD